MRCLSDTHASMRLCAYAPMRACAERPVDRSPAAAASRDRNCATARVECRARKR
ncbi:hypothetical protein BMAPRL20_A0835 [Burkholderia mallei PRL-20]|nr:hypothetical protein BMAFMH_C0342 [Burkholderia mallei FMH]EDK60324.1 hypothetical protein BMAJHU_C0358 [Burkholderia mallei JHU]EDK85931.1 hypothetical protein BMA721280_A0180 [Burkholderia mallei 2002721280]EDP88566.1 hypothetical protein BMA10399_E0423 [Burkholderia mallei ATCC 10399]EEP86403.1 conserved hypothetical protein [Burkholderia mallei GB8 horse 4]EES44450.1 hypothetical protein BMAPRL20_A0835 [Burkholderia mallei PRL-20]